jgi:hypothetical protein
VGTGDRGASNQGTSMSSPHAAGAAALLHEIHPNLQPGAIKALLQNSTVDANPGPGGDTDLARQGVGVLRVSNAAQLTSYASPGGISFGRLNPKVVTNATEQVILANLDNRSRTFTVTHRAHQTYPGVTVTCPSQVTVGRHGARPFNVRLRFDPNATAAAGVFDNASVSQTEVDGWCILQEGTDTLRVGYLAVVDAASQMILQPGPGSFGVDIHNKGPAIGLAEGFTLVGRGGEGADNTYSSISSLGVRRADPALYGGLPVLEFAVVADKTWEHISNLQIDLFLDLDRNGTDDVHLTAQDWTGLQASPPAVLGTYVTAQFIVGDGGFLDWIVNGWDFNDRVVILPFTQVAGDGLVPDSFNYRLVLTDRQNRIDVQSGSIDMANEIVPDLNSFGLAKGEKVHVGVTGGSGEMLWVFPNNHDFYQDAAAWTQPGGFH